MKMVFDSDILIWWLRGHQTIVPEIKKLLPICPLYTTPISVAEIWAGVRSGEEKQVEFCFSLLHILEINHAIGKEAGNFLKIYKKSHNVEIADALIASSAIYYRINLWTLNRKHYPMLSGEYFFSAEDNK